MTPIVKDSENAAAPASSAAPKSPAEAPARPQPVALEVPVLVNGVRTVDGSDKREPFSEKSATVLVFGHGAVIRISALLAPGQLVFLTNEKSKKEVVCQVVKAKTDGNAVGYVELRFTEPAPGFWGMRFPSDTVLPQPATRPAAPTASPAPPKATPPVVAQPVAPASSVPPPSAPVAPAPISFVPSQVSSTPAPPTESAHSIAKTKIPFPTPAPPAPILPPGSASRPDSGAPLPALSEAPPAPVAAVPVTPISTPVSSSAPSTEELKQQAARLQEQLSSLLFTESPKPAAPVASPPPPPPKESVTTEVVQKVLEMVSPAPELPAIKPIKVVAPLAQKPAAASLEVEEIKIPSWLAPLAHESETPSSPAGAFHVEGANSDVESVIRPAPEQSVLSEAQESSRRPETAVFGGQLLGETSQLVDTPAGKSRTGLFVGIAASLLLVAGGVWYSHQPGNTLSAMFSRSSTPASRPADAPETAAVSSPSAPGPVPSAAIPSSAPARVNPPSESAPAASAAAERALRSTNPVTPAAPRNPQPAVEEPKKPSLGDVHLATPTISHGASSLASGDPALDINSSSSASAPVSTLAGANPKGPVAPAPVGGDVKPARLIKSVPPEYPQMARNQRITGNVQIDALIDADGSVSSMKVLSGPPLLHQAALNALKQWKYQPAELDGKPTSMHLTVTIQFRTQ